MPDTTSSSSQMTSAQKFDFKRTNFIEKTLKNFQFLINEFGYDEPTHRISQPDNGTVILDEFRYENKNADRLITVSNAYHAVDYGFEICFYKPRRSIKHGDREMIYYVLKEDQDFDQSYIEEAAKTLKEKFRKQIKGDTWF